MATRIYAFNKDTNKVVTPIGIFGQLDRNRLSTVVKSPEEVRSLSGKKERLNPTDSKTQKSALYSKRRQQTNDGRSF